MSQTNKSWWNFPELRCPSDCVLESAKTIHEKDYWIFESKSGNSLHVKKHIVEDKHGKHTVLSFVDNLGD